MAKLLLITFIITTSSLGYSQYCMTTGPSSGIDSNLESLSLIGATGSITYTGCSGTSGVTGVEEQLSSTAYLNAGSNYTLNLQFGTCGGNYSGIGEAWIDFNLDGVFSPSESIGTWMGTPPTTASVFNFTVPVSATTGQSRMRVIQREAGSFPLDPCAPFTWGSATDFSIYIQNGVDCSTYIGDDTSTPRNVVSLPFSESYDNSFCYSNQNPVYVSPDVFYLITGLSSLSSIEVSLCGSSFDTFLSVMEPSGNIIAINDDHIDCGSQSKLTVSTNGNDSLFVIVEGWGSNSGAYNITINAGVLSLNNLEKIEDFKLIPNPAISSFKISADFTGKIEIFNSKSKKVLIKTITKGESINISTLNSGFYFVALQSDNRKVIKKLIINK